MQDDQKRLSDLKTGEYAPQQRDLRVIPAEAQNRGMERPISRQALAGYNAITPADQIDYQELQTGYNPSVEVLNKQKLENE